MHAVTVARRNDPLGNEPAGVHAAPGRAGAAAEAASDPVPRVLAPNPKLRPLLVPQRPVEQEEPATETPAASKCEVKTVQARPGRIGCPAGQGEDWHLPCERFCPSQAGLSAGPAPGGPAKAPGRHWMRTACRRYRTHGSTRPPVDCQTTGRNNARTFRVGYLEAVTSPVASARWLLGAIADSGDRQLRAGQRQPAAGTGRPVCELQMPSRSAADLLR